MSTARDDPNAPRKGEIRLDASQLRPGVHVRLPLGWLDHPYVFNSFVIASEEQVQSILALNPPGLFCDLARCQVPPLPKTALAPADAASDQARLAERARLAQIAASQIAAKRERAAVMLALRDRLEHAQQHYVHAATVAGGAIRHFEQHPRESVREIGEVSAASTASLLSDPDSAIVLIAEKGREDGAAAHALSVMTLTLLLGKQALLPPEALKVLGIGALLHDIGKCGIAPAILRNSQRNRHEEAIYQMHCRAGQEAAMRAGPLSQPVLEAIVHHHERRDGKGFPDGLKGDAIPLAARMVAIANRFDNLANPIDQRLALSPSEALARMWAKEHDAFDRVLLQLFVRAMGVYPPGSVVLLTDGRIGAVVSSAPTDHPLSPQVMVYEPDVPRREAIIVDLVAETSVRIDHALRLQDRPEDELDYLLPRRKLNWFQAESH
jgi:HD-GYP domain-containing protein (c-di-GMP phosphodiesterase class II)